MKKENEVGVECQGNKININYTSDCFKTSFLISLEEAVKMQTQIEFEIERCKFEMTVDKWRDTLASLGAFLIDYKTIKGIDYDDFSITLKTEKGSYEFDGDSWDRAIEGAVYDIRSKEIGRLYQVQVLNYLDKQNFKDIYIDIKGNFEEVIKEVAKYLKDKFDIPSDIDGPYSMKSKEPSTFFFGTNLSDKHLIFRIING